MMQATKVMIVEDDRIIVSVAKWRLTKLGYEVCGSTGTGSEAMNMIECIRPDIILVDTNIKGKNDGIESARLIKEKYNIPVILTSSDTDATTISRARTINPDGFIRKPYQDDSLRVAIELGLKK
jgi:CheY-like chemotaxis protein